MENNLKYKYLQHKHEYNLLKLVQNGGGIDFNNIVFMKELARGVARIEDIENILLEKYNMNNIGENIINLQKSILHDTDDILRSIKLKIMPVLNIPFSNPSTGLYFAQNINGESISDIFWGKSGYHTCGLAFDDSKMENIMYGGLFHSIIGGATANLNKQLSADHQIVVTTQMTKLWNDMKTQYPGIVKLGLFYLRVKGLLKIATENINMCGKNIASITHHLVKFIDNEIVTENKGILPSLICIWYAVNYHKYNKTGGKISNKMLDSYRKTLVEQNIQLEHFVDILNNSFILYTCEIQYHANILYGS
jgi:hypothetical protein